jgi:hypothetical protein
MAHNGNLGAPRSPEDDFLIEEYKGLLELDKARNERFDRLVTLFLSLAGAPWVLFALVIKEKGTFSLGDMPWLIAVVFFIVGLLGFLVVIMCIQTKFLITMYMRAVNTVRGHFVTTAIAAEGFRLPSKGTLPPYFERGSYNFYAAFGMALVNGLYVFMACSRLLNYWLTWKVRGVFGGFHVGAILVTAHYCYYLYQAAERENRGKRELTFREPAPDRKPLTITRIA